jgi:hypothetical protein
MKNRLSAYLLIVLLVAALFFPFHYPAGATGTVCSYSSGAPLVSTDVFSFSRNCGGTYKITGAGLVTYLIEDAINNAETTKAPTENAVYDALALKMNKAGTATNDDAATGGVGELLSSVVATGAAQSLTTDTAKSVTSLSLTAGDWDVTCAVDFKNAATTTATYLEAGISATNNTLGGQDTTAVDSGAITTGGPEPVLTCPVVRVSLASPTTYYMVAKAGFAVDTMGAYGTLRARRVR